MRSLTKKQMDIVRQLARNQPTIQQVRQAAWPLKEPQCGVCHRIKKAEDADFWQWGTLNGELRCPKHNRPT